MTHSFNYIDGCMDASMHTCTDTIAHPISPYISATQRILLKPEWNACISSFCAIRRQAKLHSSLAHTHTHTHMQKVRVIAVKRQQTEKKMIKGQRNVRSGQQTYMHTVQHSRFSIILRLLQHTHIRTYMSDRAVFNSGQQRQQQRNTAQR